LPAMAVIRREVLINSVYAGYGYETLRFTPEYQKLLVPHVYLVDVCNTADKLHHPSVVDRVREAMNVCVANLDSTAPVSTAENPFENTPLTGFDYLLVVNNRYFRYPVPGILRPVYSAADTVLYQVVR